MRAALARALSPVVWNLPGHRATKLFRFALAEHGSMLDLHTAARLTPCPERRAAYVRHAIDEARHAEMFTLRSAELRVSDGKASLGAPRADSEGLFTALGEIRFLAFVHHGERRGCRQFEGYRDWLRAHGDHKTSAMFQAILKDEYHHMSYTRELLVELSGSEAAARRELRRAIAWEAWRTWRRWGRFLAAKVYFVSMVALSVLMLPFSLLLRASRPAPRGWHAIERPSLRFPSRAS
jgi:hypothetical protein